jgi:hypothetical protein
MITTVKPLTVEHARCLTMACELRRLLGELCQQPGNGAGSCVEDAWERMDDVIGMLEPEDEELGEDRRPTREERRAAWRTMYGEEPPPGWPPPELRVIAGKDAKP